VSVSTIKGDYRKLGSNVTLQAFQLLLELYIHVHSVLVDSCEFAIFLHNANGNVLWHIALHLIVCISTFMLMRSGISLLRAFDVWCCGLFRVNTIQLQHICFSYSFVFSARCILLLLSRGKCDYRLGLDC
jgi:hypothetical protein